MACEQELADLQNAVLTRLATAQALLAANSAKFAADMAAMAAAVNYTTALANDNAAAALVTQKQAAYDACVNGMPAPPPEPPEAELMPSAQRKGKRPPAKKKPKKAKEPKPPVGPAREIGEGHP